MNEGPHSTVLGELKRRNVFRVGAAYAVTAWLIIQMVETIFPAFGFGHVAVRVVVIVLAIGFVPAVIVAWAFELTPQGLMRDRDVDRSRSITPQTGKRLDRMIMVVLALALAYFAFDKFVLGPAREAELIDMHARNPDRAGARLASPNAIAVLPFVNISPDPDQEYFSDGLAEEILNVISRVPGLAVTSRTSSFAYKGTTLTIAQIAEELNARYLVEGSVRKAGNDLRIVAKLIDASRDQQIWSQDFEGEAGDVFEMQDRTANAILLALNIQLDEDRGRLSGISGTTNVLAHDLLLKGRYFFNQRELPRAVDLFQQATEADPGYGEAYALLALSKSLGHGALDPSGAQAALDNALELAPLLPITLIAEGLTARRAFDFETAGRALRKALQVEPRNALALHLLGNLQFAFGRYEEALELGQRAVEIDPAVAIYRNYVAIYGLALGRTEEGLENFAAANRLAVHNLFKQWIWRILSGDSESVLQELESPDTGMSRIQQSFVPFFRAFALIEDGKLMQARELIAQVREFPGGADLEILVIVSVYLGDIESANQFMQTMVEGGDALGSLRAYLPFMKNFHIEQTRFAELREQMGLPGLQ